MAMSIPQTPICLLGILFISQLPVSSALISKFLPLKAAFKVQLIAGEKPSHGYGHHSNLKSNGAGGIKSCEKCDINKWMLPDLGVVDMKFYLTRGRKKHHVPKKSNYRGWKPSHKPVLGYHNQIQYSNNKEKGQKEAQPTSPVVKEYEKETSQSNQGQTFENQEVKYENQGLKYENQGQKYENQGLKYENQGPKYENQGLKYENQGQKYENQGPKYENQGLKNENQGQKYENQGPKFENQEVKFNYQNLKGQRGQGQGPVENHYVQKGQSKWPVKNLSYYEKNQGNVQAVQHWPGPSSDDGHNVPPSPTPPEHSDWSGNGNYRQGPRENSRPNLNDYGHGHYEIVGLNGPNPRPFGSGPSGPPPEYREGPMSNDIDHGPSLHEHNPTGHPNSHEPMKGHFWSNNHEENLEYDRPKTWQKTHGKQFHNSFPQPNKFKPFPSLSYDTPFGSYDHEEHPPQHEEGPFHQDQDERIKPYEHGNKEDFGEMYKFVTSKNKQLPNIFQHDENFHKVEDRLDQMASTTTSKEVIAITSPSSTKEDFNKSKKTNLSDLDLLKILLISKSLDRENILNKTANATATVVAKAKVTKLTI